MPSNLRRVLGAVTKGIVMFGARVNKVVRESAKRLILGGT